MLVTESCFSLMNPGQAKLQFLFMFLAIHSQLAILVVVGGGALYKKEITFLSGDLFLLQCLRMNFSNLSLPDERQ